MITERKKANHWLIVGLLAMLFVLIPALAPDEASAEISLSNQQSAYTANGYDYKFYDFKGSISINIPAADITTGDKVGIWFSWQDGSQDPIYWYWAKTGEASNMTISGSSSVFNLTSSSLSTNYQNNRANIPKNQLVFEQDLYYGTYWTAPGWTSSTILPPGKYYVGVRDSSGTLKQFKCFAISYFGAWMSNEAKCGNNAITVAQLASDINSDAGFYDAWVGVYKSGAAKNFDNLIDSYRVRNKNGVESIVYESNKLPPGTYDVVLVLDDSTNNGIYSKIIRSTTFKIEDHNYSSSVTDPTCTADGYTTYTCPCGSSYTGNQVAAKGHNSNTNVPGKAATCTATGLTDGKKCSVCGTVTVEQQVIEATGHNSNTNVPGKAATCTATGLTDGKKCSVCGTVTVAQQQIAALGHTAGAAATCTTNQTCTVCSEILVGKKGHDYKAVITPSTCLDKGYTTHTCGRCNDSFIDTPTAALGHDYQNVSGYPATCTADGLTDGSKCTRCDDWKTKQITIVSKGHQWEDTTVHTPDTCEGKGYMNQKCSVNGCTATQLREVDEIKDHSRQTVEAVEPTCTSFGTVAHKKCTLCNALFDTNNKPITAPDPISKREHNMTEHAAVEPSCTKDGTVAYKFCSSCEQNFNMQNQVIQSIVWKALGHNYSSKVTAPTCTEKGYTTHTCTRTGCGFTTTDTETDALGHNYIGVVTAPTCTVDGYTTYTCSNGCGSTYVADTVKAEGHKFNTETGRVEATCTTDGSITKECDNCTETKTETIKSNGHDEILSTITAANCTQSGQERVQCSKCNLDTTRAIAPLGHKMNEATCKLPETCSVCGTTQGTANGHDFIIYNKQEPTCTATGLTAGRNCKNCDEEDMPQEIIPALGHKAPENAPDCQKHKCATCNSEMDNEVQPHTLGAWIIHEATCEDGGYKEKICSKCKQQIEKEITSEKRAHDWGTYSYKEDGSHIRYCQYSDCNASETQDCKMIHKELDPATCTENGVAEHYKCNICNTSYINGKKVAEKDLVIPAGHNPVVKVDAKESSCSQSGNILHWLCKTCEKTYSDEDCTIENPYVNLGFGHKMNHVAAKAATCNETGTKEHYYCEACGFYYEDKDGLKVLGNKEEDVTLPAKCTLKRMEGYSPTCSQTGMLPYYVCTVCGESYADENEAPLAGQDLTIPAKGHTSENMILFQEQTKADNCDDRENTYYAIYKCIHECCEGILYKHEDGSDTWNSIEEAMIAKHNPGNAATCTTDQTCEDCGDVIVEKLNHDGWRKEVAATCTSDGTKAHFNCQRCKAQYKVEKLYDAEGNELSATDIVIPLNGHSWSTEWDRDSKHHWHPCTACGIAKTDEGYIEHSFEEEEITAPTCNTTGEMLYKCECGYSYDETIPATGKHAWIEDGEPTNQNKPCGDGTQNYKCGTCGSEKSEFILGNDKHDPNMTAPTCTEDVVCNLCDEVLEHAPGHNDGGLKPSCQAAVNCMVCNAPMYQIQDHDWSGDAATCVKPQVCVNCPKVLVPATGKHTWELTETKDSTCTAKGSKLFTCTVCGETRVDVIELKDHNYTSVVVTAPTCTNKGYTTHTCECGHTYDDSYVDALGHDISKTGEVTKEADCVTNGVKAYACQRKGCNHSVLEQIANKGGHKNTTVVTAATCETKGYTTHTCTVCGNVEKTNEVKALGHNYSSAVTEPTCTAQGYTTYTCANCGDAYKADYVNAAHEYITETKDPTCTNRGYTAFTCVHCGDSFKDAYQEATGHAWDEGKDQVAPDCMTSGVKVFTCATCKETKTETVPAKGQHSYTTTVVAGGCTTAGYTLNTCTGCGHSYKTNLTAVAGHKPVVIPAKKATCTETGLTAGKKCETCNEILTAQSVTEKLGHVAAKTTITKATKKAAGAIVKTCACGEEVSRVAIAKIASEKLNYSAVVYDGREKGPKLIIKDANGKKLKKNTDYTVKMPGKRVAIGVYTYTITYKGNYSGTSKVTLTIMPKATTISKVSGTKKAVTVKWKKAAKKQTTGYEIMVATNKNFTKGKKTVTVKGYNKTSAKVTKLSAKKTYYARVRTYKTVNGKKVYSKWSTVKTVKTK